MAHALAAISVLYSLERAYGVLAWLHRLGRRQTKLPLSSLPEGSNLQMTSVAGQCHCEVPSALSTHACMAGCMALWCSAAPAS